MTVREALEVAMQSAKSSGHPEEIKLIQDAIDKVESKNYVPGNVLKVNFFSGIEGDAIHIAYFLVINRPWDCEDVNGAIPTLNLQTYKVGRVSRHDVLTFWPSLDEFAKSEGVVL